MDRQQLLANKKILIIDPSEKIENDKTFCFWANQEDEIYRDYASIISHQWSSIQINESSPEPIAPLNYFHINAIDLYNKARALIQKFNITHELGKVLGISEGNFVKVDSSNQSYYAPLVFDSRSIDYEKLKKSSHFIYQSFYGLKVKLKKQLFNSSVYRMMDFRVPQDVATQFVYILPYDGSNGLIELTRFGRQVIDKDVAKNELSRFIDKNFGEYEIEDEEFGIIPMAPIDMDVNTSKKIIQIGTRAGSVKPSTGYAFKNMYAHAKSICSNGIQPKKITPNKRFAFYDELLLIILSKWPAMGKPIFERLFSKKSGKFVLDFLDEKTTIFQDISIFGKLQISVFLKAIVYWFKERSTSFLFTMLFIVSIFFFENDSSGELFLNKFQLGLFASGLLLVGIPHGALDHLTESISSKKKITLSFTLTYLGLMVPIFCIWYYLPLSGLIIFLIYSAWHFGQTDMNHWKIQSPVLNFLWGITLLSYMLFSHPFDFTSIIQYLGITIAEIDDVFPLVSKTLLFCCIGIALYKKKLDWILWCIFLLLSTNISLLLTFGIYFIFHHSRIGWMDLKSKLKVSHLNMFFKALPFNLGAVLIYFIFFVKGNFTIEQNVSYFFIFLSCISFPHVICMSYFYKNLSKQLK